VKKLYRSKKNRVLLGVLGGLGEYMGVDPTVLRLVFVLVMLLTAVIPLTLFYFIAALIIPEAPDKA